jgi:hypothetical protein
MDRGKMSGRRDRLYVRGSRVGRRGDDATDEGMLRDAFSRAGEVDSITMREGYAFVQLKSEEDAEVSGSRARAGFWGESQGSVGSEWGPA